MLKYASPKSTAPNAEICLTKTYHTRCWSMPHQNLPHQMLNLNLNVKPPTHTLYIGLFIVTASSPTVHRVDGKFDKWAINWTERGPRELGPVALAWRDQRILCFFVPCIVLQLCDVNQQNALLKLMLQFISSFKWINPLSPELNPICYLLALLGAHYFLHVSRIRVKLLTLRRLMSYIYGAPILGVSRSHTTTQHSR